MSTCSTLNDDTVARNVSDNMSQDNDDEHWNDVWYATSDDYDSDCHDAYCTSDADTSHIDDSMGEGLELIFPHGSPTRMSLREGMAQSLYERACNRVSRICTNA
jgi:hypothetical protein